MEQNTNDNQTQARQAHLEKKNDVISAMDNNKLHMVVFLTITGYRRNNRAILHHITFARDNIWVGQKLN